MHLYLNCPHTGAKLVLLASYIVVYHKYSFIWDTEISYKLIYFYRENIEQKKNPTFQIKEA